MNSFGYSERINDPAFKKYIRNNKQWAGIFSMILAVIVIVSFAIYGHLSDEMDNPEALYIGLVIGGMFIAIGLYKIIGIKRSITWDGKVTNKLIRHKRKDRLYIEYIVVITEHNSGKIYELTSVDDDTVYNYYQIGDLVRHHGGLNSYEKYDKTNDTIIFCNACATLHDIQDDVCFRCHCPLLK
ncbi:MAG: hypothetical protein KMY55_09390 [Dethiosulfatibacter sp.]|nr:hypothetical protein [Dethiosulfatibacter sp.]